jgi:hypothetical protein
MGGGSDTQATTQSQSTTQLPPWINQAAQQNYAFAQNVANRPLQQYQGQMVADVSPQTQQSWNVAAGGGNAGADQYNAANAGYLGLMGQSPMDVRAGQLSSTNLAPYMNPYTQNVINKTLPIMQQQLQLTQNQQANQANAANAFGGSRFGVQQGVTQAQGAQNMAQMAAQLNQANFGQAQTAAQQDITGRMNAALANQSVQQNQAGLNLQAAGGLAGLGQQAQINQVRNFGELQAAGSQQQQQAQNQINAQLQKFQQAWGYPTQQLGALQSALGMTPYGTATQGQSTTQQQTATDPLTGGLGALQMLGSLFSTPAGVAGGAAPVSAASGFLGMLGGSDRQLKTDITRVDTHPTGLPVYAYRYKGDPKTYPKVVGPMAEDVAKIAPHAVRPMGVKGRLAVHMPTLDALAASRAAGPPLRFAPPGGAGPIGAGPPPGAPPAGLGMGPPIPGPLAGPGVAGPIGALGAPMRRGPQGPRLRARPPPLRGALGG